jgi:hypothetical protein
MRCKIGIEPTGRNPRQESPPNGECSGPWVTPMNDEANWGAVVQTPKRVGNMTPVLIVPATANEHSLASGLFLMIHSPAPHAARTIAIASCQAVSLKIENHHEKAGGHCDAKGRPVLGLVGSSRALGCWKARQVEPSTAAEIENRWDKEGGHPESKAARVRRS